MKHVRTGIALTAIAMSSLLAVTACGQGRGGAQQSGQGIAKEITVAAVNDQSGPVGYAGISASQGARLAVEQINDQGYLGDGVVIDLAQSDPAGEIERAVSDMTKAMADNDVSAILGPTLGQQAAAVAPLVNQRKVPTVFTQSGSPGVVTGDYTFRATAPMETYYSAGDKWLAENDFTKLSLIYNGTLPTYASLVEDVITPDQKKYGLSIDQRVEVQSTTLDFTSQAQRIAAAKPQAVVMLLTAPQSVTFMKQLRQAGYTGQVLGSTNQSAGMIAPAGPAADGLVYPVDFSASMDTPESKAFVDAFAKEYGEAPDPYAAEGFDALWWIARGIKASNDSSRDGVQKGLAQVASQGFAGAMGDITFDGNDMRVPGVVVKWQDGKEHLLR
ncbi:ABC transporter substrate-binding protein [Gordonia sp. HY002]|uniref:ABC transporter substrate-binding protein n=2 Tax=Gordonia zhenghanii TaxID=2911516 RepID=UPI001F379F4F|nr:ABC transporter substrate-binding protein [Gordonia zhenghanii]MCF8570167.1 ABC transporter substrate-binding protein [Gordonia zhenghanii]